MSSEYETERSLVLEIATETNDLCASLAPSRNEFKFLEGQITLVQIKTVAVVFERDACTAKHRRLQTLFRRYQDACSPVARGLNEKGVCSEASGVVATFNSKGQVNHFCRRLLAMKDFMCHKNRLGAFLRTRM